MNCFSAGRADESDLFVEVDALRACNRGERAVRLLEGRLELCSSTASR